jgi:hypothetical protein
MLFSTRSRAETSSSTRNLVRIIALTADFQEVVAVMSKHTSLPSRQSPTAGSKILLMAQTRSGEVQRIESFNLSRTLNWRRLERCVRRQRLKSPVSLHTRWKGRVGALAMNIAKLYRVRCGNNLLGLERDVILNRMPGRSYYVRATSNLGILMQLAWNNFE